MRFARTLNPSRSLRPLPSGALRGERLGGAGGRGGHVTHPLHFLTGVVGPGWGSDPARAFGRLVPTVLAAWRAGGPPSARLGMWARRPRSGAHAAASTRGARSAVGRWGRWRPTGARSAVGAARASPRPPRRPRARCPGSGRATARALGRPAPDCPALHPCPRSRRRRRRRAPRARPRRPRAGAQAAGRTRPHAEPAPGPGRRRRGRALTRRSRPTRPWRSDWPGSAAACRRRGNGWRPRTSHRR